MSKKNYISEAALKDKPQSKYHLVIKDGAVSSDKLANGAVKTEKIADGNITTEKVMDKAITNDKLADKTITADKFSDELHQDTIEAINELREAKFDKSDIVQELGENNDKVVSQSLFNTLYKEQSLVPAFTDSTLLNKIIKEVYDINNVLKNVTLEQEIEFKLYRSFPYNDKYINGVSINSMLIGYTSYDTEDDAENHLYGIFGSGESPCGYVVCDLRSLNKGEKKEHINSHLLLRKSLENCPQIHAYLNEQKISVKLDKSDIVQELGENNDKVVSQSVVSKAIESTAFSLMQGARFSGSVETVPLQSGKVLSRMGVLFDNPDYGSTDYITNDSISTTMYICVRCAKFVSFDYRYFSTFCIYDENKKLVYRSYKSIDGIIAVKPKYSIIISIRNNSKGVVEKGNIDSIITVPNVVDTIAKPGFDFISHISDNINDFNRIRQIPGFASVFRTWGFVGDSLSSGEMQAYKPDGSFAYIDMYEYSWGQFLCRMCGAEGYNFSIGGQTTEGWITGETSRTWDESKTHNGASTNLKQAYFIAIGTNDSSIHYEVGSTDTDIDMSDYHNNAKTFAGNYAGIIQRLRSVNPKCYIFIVTVPRASATEYNEVIRKMPTLFDRVFLIDLEPLTDMYSSQEFKDKYYLTGHMNPAGYLYTAYLFTYYVDWYVQKYPEIFRTLAIMDTNYTDIKPSTE